MSSPDARLKWSPRSFPAARDQKCTCSTATSTAAPDKGILEFYAPRDGRRPGFQVTVAIFSAGAAGINLVNPGARDSSSRDAVMDNKPAARILLAITRPSSRRHHQAVADATRRSGQSPGQGTMEHSYDAHRPAARDA